MCSVIGARSLIPRRHSGEVACSGRVWHHPLAGVRLLVSGLNRLSWAAEKANITVNHCYLADEPGRSRRTEPEEGLKLKMFRNGARVTRLGSWPNFLLDLRYLLRRCERASVTDDL